MVQPDRLFEGVDDPRVWIKILRLFQFIRKQRGEDADILLIELEDIDWRRCDGKLLRLGQPSHVKLARARLGDEALASGVVKRQECLGFPRCFDVQPEKKASPDRGLESLFNRDLRVAA